MATTTAQGMASARSAASSKNAALGRGVPKGALPKGKAAKAGTRPASARLGAAANVNLSAAARARLGAQVNGTG